MQKFAVSPLVEKTWVMFSLLVRKGLFSAIVWKNTIAVYTHSRLNQKYDQIFTQSWKESDHNVRKKKVESRNLNSSLMLNIWNFHKGVESSKFYIYLNAIFNKAANFCFLQAGKRWCLEYQFYIILQSLFLILWVRRTNTFMDRNYPWRDVNDNWCVNCQWQLMSLLFARWCWQ